MAPPTLDEATARGNIEALLGNPTVTAFAVVGSSTGELRGITTFYDHAFDVWGCVRVALRCDAANERSAGAIRRLGARPEGVLRNHRRRHDGTVGDTAYFSITDVDWPGVRAGLRGRVRS